MTCILWRFIRNIHASIIRSDQPRQKRFFKVGNRSIIITIKEKKIDRTWCGEEKASFIRVASYV